MSYAAIRNGTASILSACGPWLQAEISSCDFGILEGVASCGIIFTPGPNSVVEPLTFGDTNLGPRDYMRRWDISGLVAIKDTGDPTTVYSRAWQAHDDIYDTFAKDDTLLGAACAARLTRLSFNPREYISWNGQDFAIVRWGIVAEEF